MGGYSGGFWQLCEAAAALSTRSTAASCMAGHSRAQTEACMAVHATKKVVNGQSIGKVSILPKVK